MEALRAWLLADSAVSALVGTRIYPQVFPQGINEAAIRYSIISGTEGVTTDGPDGLDNTFVQIDCVNTSFAGMDSLFRAVVDRLNGASFKLAGIDVQGIFLVRKRDLYDDATKLYRRTADYSIWNGETV